MTAAHILDPATVLKEAMGQGSPDLRRSLLQTMINALLSADSDYVVGAEYGNPSATATATGALTHGRASPISQYRNSARAPTSRNDCSSGVRGSQR